MRYTRQIILPEFGVLNQEKLRNAKVLIIGCGGLGTPISTELAAMGIGSLQLMDGDCIEMENLHRQFHFNPDGLGKNKAETLSQKLSEQNPEIQVEGIPKPIRFPEDNYRIQQTDLVIDTCDDLSSRISISQACNELQKPLFYAAASGWKGMIMAQIPKTQFNLSERLKETEPLTCNETGIFPPVLFWVSSLITTEVIRYITNGFTQLEHKFEIFDALQFKHQTFQLNNYAKSYTEAKF